MSSDDPWCSGVVRYVSKVVDNIVVKLTGTASLASIAVVFGDKSELPLSSSHK